MKYEGTYYLAKPLRRAFERKANGEEPYVYVGIYDHLWLFAELFSESGEKATFHYEVEANKDTGIWEFRHDVFTDEGIHYEADQPVSLTGTMTLTTDEHEFVLHFVEYMCDYDEKEYRYLTEELHRASERRYPYPDRETMLSIVDHWHQGEFSEFLRANREYHETFNTEAKRTKTGKLKKGEYEAWLQRHHVRHSTFRSNAHYYSTPEYRLSSTIYKETESGMDTDVLNDKAGAQSPSSTKQGGVSTVILRQSTGCDII